MAVAGTGTEVGKTWVASAVLGEARRRGFAVAARKPAQSFDGTGGQRAGGRPGADDPTDAERLAGATGEQPEHVCPPHRTYPVALAPPMAAEALGLPAFGLDELLGELRWPDGVDLGLVELAGGVRSPQAADGDGLDLLRRLAPDDVVLVADAGLGTLNAVRLTLDALAGAGFGPTPHRAPLLVLDRYHHRLDVHVRNRTWLEERDGHRVFVVPGEEAALVDRLVERRGP